jgi:hypothetical protein
VVIVIVDEAKAAFSLFACPNDNHDLPLQVILLVIKIVGTRKWLEQSILRHPGGSVFVLPLFALGIRDGAIGDITQACESMRVALTEDQRRESVTLLEDFKGKMTEH